jgi:hypothetical protein
MGAICDEDKEKEKGVDHRHKTDRHTELTLEKISIFYTNADQLPNKMNELRTRILHMKTQPHIIAITEAKPKNSRFPMHPADYKIDGYQTFSQNLSEREGRGIILYALDWMDIKVVSNTPDYQESLWVEVKMGKGGGKLLCGIVYRSPSQQTETNMQLLNQMLRSVADKKSQLLILGDFNFPHIDWSNWTLQHQGPAESEFLKSCMDCLLTQHIQEPTRGRLGQNPNILDLVFTLGEDEISQIEFESPLGKSDHVCLTFDFLCPLKYEPITRTVYLYNKANYEEMRHLDWNGMIEEGRDVTEDYQVICDIYEERCTAHIPRRTFAAGERRKKPGVTAEIAKAIKKKHRSWTRYMETRTPAKYKEYARSRNKSKALVKKATREHEKKIADNAKKNPKEFWSYANLKMKSREKVAEIYSNNQKTETTADDKEKARIMNDFFASVFTDEPVGEAPTPEERNYEEPLTTIEFEEQAIAEKLKGLDPSKSKGPDNIHPRVLKELHAQIAKPLKELFEKCLRTGDIPADWRKANVTAIYKKGDKHEPSNYRPVSLTAVPCKVMEFFVREAIVDHMERNGLFTEYQFGFRARRSTTLQLLLALEEWTKRLDEGLVVDTCYIDVKKAFDTVPHRRLLKKLNSYGIQGEILRWIEAFLRDREQSVTINGEKSEAVRVKSGVPQGSVLGPTLFIIYVNDMPEVVQSHLLLYADDSKLYRAVKENKDVEYLQSDLDALQEWSNKWLLTFHPEKCKVIRIGNKEQARPTYVMRSGSGVGMPVMWTAAEKDLGVIVDEGLRFQKEIETRLKKGNTIVGVIRRTFSYLDERMFKTLFTALVRPHLEYACSVWMPHLLKDIRSLEGVQRRATRMVPSLRNLSYPERLQKLGLPTLSYRRRRGDAIECYKIFNGQYNIDPAKFFTIAEERRTRGHEMKVVKKSARTTTRQQVFSMRVVNDWNSLPESVVSAPSLNSFKNRLDQHWKQHPNLHNPI